MNPPAANPATLYWTLEAELAPEAEELWGLFCYERGATGAAVLAEDGGRLRIVHFFDAVDSDRSEAWLAAFREQFPRARPPETLRLVRRPREDWATAWREHFAPLDVGRRFRVCPPWDEPGPEDQSAAGESRLRIVIDPGQGFGTGRHPSTALVLDWLVDLVSAGQPPWLLDVGSGSGILAIGARLLGVPRVLAVEIDPRALPEARRNAALSGVEGGILWVCGGPWAVSRPAPLVLANLEMPLLSVLAPVLTGCVAPGGWLVVSGVLARERSALEGAYRAQGLEPEAVRELEGWVAVCWRQPDTDD